MNVNSVDSFTWRVKIFGQLDERLRDAFFKGNAIGFVRIFNDLKVLQKDIRYELGESKILMLDSRNPTVRKLRKIRDRDTAYFYYDIEEIIDFVMVLSKIDINDEKVAELTNIFEKELGQTIKSKLPIDPRQRFAFSFLFNTVSRKYTDAPSNIEELFLQIWNESLRRVESTSEGWMDDFYDALENLLAWIDPVEFRNRLGSVGTLILGARVPDGFHEHFHEIRHCFALGMYSSAVVFCRAIIEVAFREYWERRGSADISKESLQDMINEAKEMQRVLRDSAHEVRIIVNDLLHEKGVEGQYCIGEDKALEVIRKTFRVVENMF